MNARDRFNQTLKFDILSLDRLPTIEWAPWWDLTAQRWEKEGLKTDKSCEQICKDLGLDVISMINCSAIGEGFIFTNGEGKSVIHDETDYIRVSKNLYTDEKIEKAVHQAKKLKDAHVSGDIIIRVWLDGFFWHPRELFGIENHLYAFYDKKDLMHQINSNLADYNIRILQAVLDVLKPDMVGFAEDMSYNHGPMLSKELFDEFIKPYYLKVNKYIKQHDIKIFVDSDGDIAGMIDWLIEVDIEGIYPLERQAGVDINQIRKKYPRFLMMGGFDKTVMSKGESAVRHEFERILPAMASGGYIPSVDHQTPPDVSLNDYRTYLQIFKEYAEKATKCK